MKNSINFLTCTAVLLFFNACDPIMTVPNAKKYVKNDKSFSIGPSGGQFNAMSGNVTLIIPKGALEETISVLIEEGPTDDDKEFIIKSIVIKPKTVTFKIPVGLSLRYDGQLSLGLDPSNANSLVLYHFEREVDFDKKNKMIWVSKCYVNYFDQHIETEIYKGGIFAIGEEILGQYGR